MRKGFGFVLDDGLNGVCYSTLVVDPSSHRDRPRRRHRSAVDHSDGSADHQNPDLARRPTSEDSDCATRTINDATNSKGERFTFETSIVTSSFRGRELLGAGRF